MSRSSGHHHTVHESKSVKFWKSFLAFILFLSLAATSLCACTRLVILSPSSMIKLFCSEEYIAALEEDITEYAFDACASSSLPYDCVDGVITFGTLYQIEKAYIAGAMEADEEYTSTTYQDYIEKLGEAIKAATEDTMEKQAIVADESVSDGADQFAARITDYVTERVEFPLMDELQAAMNVGSIGATVGAIVFAVISALMALIILTFKTKIYRSMREIVYAFLAASLLDLSLVGGVALVGCFKDLVLYPTYLADAVMAYIGNCMLAVGLTALLLFVIALVLMTIIWKIKRDNNM